MPLLEAPAGGGTGGGGTSSSGTSSGGVASGGGGRVGGGVLLSDQRSLLHHLSQEDVEGVGNSIPAQQLLLAEALHVAIGEGSRTMVFKLIHHTTGQSMTQLVRFRTAFCANAQEQGLTDRDAEQRWEKIVQAIYSRLSRGPVQGTAKVSMVLSKGIPKDLTEDRAMSFAREELGETFSLDQPTLSTHLVNTLSSVSSQL